MNILAHRGIGFGHPENSQDAFAAALKAGFGLELDVRQRQDGVVVVGHDAQDPSAWPLEDFWPHLAQTAHPIAIHLKEQNKDLATILARWIRPGSSIFIFDVTQEFAHFLKPLFPHVRLGFSVSEKPFLSTLYTLDQALAWPECDVIWWDEWSELGAVYRKDSRARIAASGKPVFAVSPELHAFGSPSHTMAAQPETAWALLQILNVDGICTDWPRRLAQGTVAS